MAQKIALGQRYYNYGFTDSVLFTEAYMRPRYKGSKLIGAKINEYTDYTQLSTTEFGLRSRLLTQDRLGYINTSKIIDGTFPYPLTFGRDTTLSADNFFISIFRGNQIFPNPAFNSERDLLNQNGTVSGDSDLAELVNGLLTFENQYSGGYLRDRSYGRNPVIEVKTNTIYEFDWGGSTYPEIEKGGAVHLKQILNVDSYAKGNPNVYIVNEATNDSFRIDTSITNGQGANIVLTDNPGEETDFSINFKRSLAFGDRITLNSYIAGNELVAGPESVVGGINELIEEINAVPVKNVVTLEPGIGVPSYTGIYTQRRVGTNTNYTSSLTGEPVGVPYLPRKESGEFGYKPVGDFSPEADFYTADFQNPGGPDVLASTLRNVSGSYYLPTTSGGGAPMRGWDFNGSEGRGRIELLLSGGKKYLKINPEGLYTTGSNFTNNNSIITELSASLANNNRHFVSFYGSLGNVAVGDLNQIGEPVEISLARIEGGSSYYIYVKDKLPVVGDYGIGDVGLLIWKAQQGPFAVIKPTDTTTDYSYKYLRTGGFYREYSTLTIKQHFDDIVKTVGMKPNL